MLLSKKTIFLPLTLSILTIAPIFAKKPESFLGKIGASLLQTVNAHPFITSCAAIGTVVTSVAMVSNNKELVKSLAFNSPLLVFFGLYLVETGSKALMKNFEVDPIQ